MTFRLPTWVKDADGRTVPFDADRISQRLFAATANLGTPNSFLARELTDGVLHFLAQAELGDTTEWPIVDDVVEKVIRELGHPALARTYARGDREDAAPQVEDADRIPFDLPLHRAIRQVRATYALQSIFGPDLRSACEDGLIVLGGLQSPDRLAAQLVADIAAAGESPWEFGWRLVRNSAIGAGGRLVLADVEPAWENRSTDELRAFLYGLRAGLESLDANLAVCLHPPRPETATSAGTLFAGAGENTVIDHAAFYRKWFEAWNGARLGKRGVIYWGLDEATLAELPASFGKREDAADLVYVFHRPRRPASLAEGLVRPAPAILLEAGLALDRFADMAGVDRDPALFLEKLGSLVRIAVSAATRKRAYLRKTSGSLQRGFMLDRAALHLAPLGLEAAVQSMLGEWPSRSQLSLDLACRIADRLREIAQAEARTANLEIIVDSPFELVEPAHEVETPLRLHLEACGQIHRRQGQGTVHIRRFGLPGEGLDELLSWTWRKTELSRLMIAAPRDVQTQLLD